MKKEFLIVIAVFVYSSCHHNFELSKEEVEYLTYSEESNWKIDFGQPLLTGDYEDWKSWQYAILKDDATKGPKPYVVVSFGADSVRVSLLPLTESLKRESHKDSYAVEWAVVSNGMVKFIPSDYFNDSGSQIFLNDLSEAVKERYNYSDSLNLKCPEWWIIGGERSDVIERQIFEEILVGYVDFTRGKFVDTSQSEQFEKLLREHKRRFPFRVSIEEPICRYGLEG